MDNRIKNIMENMEFTTPATTEEINAAEKELGLEFPKSYVDFLLITNGAEGSIGEENYLVLWSVNEIVELNNEYAVKEFTPQLTYFGSDGGGTAYAFDVSGDTISFAEIPFESIDIEDRVHIANSFNAFVEALAK